MGGGIVITLLRAIVSSTPMDRYVIEIGNSKAYLYNVEFLRRIIFFRLQICSLIHLFFIHNEMLFRIG
jgi:hypothetical protein